MTQKELESVEKTFAAFGGYINYEDYIFLLTVLTSNVLISLLRVYKVYYSSKTKL